MAAMMAGRFTQEITPDISNVMPILDDIWIYIHTNVIIASYALIGISVDYGPGYCPLPAGRGQPRGGQSRRRGNADPGQCTRARRDEQFLA